MTCAAFGSPRVLVSYCKTNSRSAVTAEAAGSSPVVPAIFSITYRKSVLDATVQDCPRSRSKPIRENQLDKAGNPVGIKSLIADFVLSILLPGIAAPVWPGAVEIGKSVLPGQCPGTEDTSA